MDPLQFEGEEAPPKEVRCLARKVPEKPFTVLELISGTFTFFLFFFFFKKVEGLGKAFRIVFGFSKSLIYNAAHLPFFQNPPFSFPKRPAILPEYP